MVTGKLAVCLALVVVLGQVQCVAACVGDVCALPDHSREQRTLPPCHRQHSEHGTHTGDPKGHASGNACTHEASAAALMTAHVSVAAPLPATAPHDPEPPALLINTRWPVELADLAPPLASGIPSSVLRI